MSSSLQSDASEGCPSDAGSPFTGYDSEAQFSRISSPCGEIIPWSLPEYVTASEVELISGSNSQCSPLRTELTLAPDSLPSCSTNTSQTLSITSGQACGKSQSRSKQVGAATRRRRDDQNTDDESCTLDEFWYEHGKDWSKVQPSTQERKEFRSRRIGLASCQTAPECYTCGTRLDMDEIINPVPCRICCCFN
ncbi:hypothetical protein F4804DRAFT_311341 [Jackrogersella minutella]|nr:hypothetical protein F4804DRAFT_311341 [Jackrogersella minutella]